MMKRQSCFFSLVLLSIFLLGCSGKVGVHGNVVFSDDDSPLTRGAVCFESPNYTARGPLQQDGSYELGSTASNDGIVPGIYKVYIVGAYADTRTDAETPLLLIDEKYTDSTISGLTAEVTASNRRFDFKVDRGPSK